MLTVGVVLIGCGGGAASETTKHNLTVSSTKGGVVSTPREETHVHDQGTVVDLVAEADEDYYFANWIGDVGTIADIEDTSTSITMNGDYLIAASFRPIRYSLSISSSAGGSVTAPGTGAFIYDAGTVVNLLVNAEEGYLFRNWTGDVGMIASISGASTTIEVHGDCAITANFEQIPPGQFALTVSSSAGGSVPTPGEGRFTYDQGTVVNLAASAAGGYRFGNWTGDVDTIANVDTPETTITMQHCSSITAGFEPQCMPMVVAGDYHTVGVKCDGTVVAVGYNLDGQCNVGDWMDIVQVAAAWAHTVGLKRDGTTVAVGYNRNGQCDVDDWAHIVQIAASHYHTVGLKCNGTVVAVGCNSAGQCDVSGWMNITQVTAGIFHTVGLKSDGTVVAAGYNRDGQCDVGGWTNVVQVAAGQLHTVGLKSDGTVVATGDDHLGQRKIAYWTGITEIAAGYYHTVGLRSDGTVVAVGWSEEEQCGVGIWAGVVQIAAGCHHTVGLKSDGTVVAVGDNCCGICNVGDWNLNWHSP
jgi:hypothetical protein